MADSKNVITKLPKLKVLQAPKVKKESEDLKMDHEMSEYDRRPEFRIEGKDVPEIKDWKVGSEYTVVMKVKMEGLRSRLESGKEYTCGDFRVISIGVAK